MQTIIEFTMYATWITFGYEYWKTIHDEIGRYLHSFEHIQTYILSFKFLWYSSQNAQNNSFQQRL